MALIGSLSNIGNTALCLSGNSAGGGNTTNSGTPQAIYIINDPLGTNTVWYGFDNTVTAAIATLSNTVNDNTTGYPLKVGQEIQIGAKEFLMRGLTPSPANIYVITTTAPQRVLYKVL